MNSKPTSLVLLDLFKRLELHIMTRLDASNLIVKEFTVDLFFETDWCHL